MSEESNAAAVRADGLTVLRRGSPARAGRVAVGPTLDETLAATSDLDATVAYLATVRPFDADGLRALVGDGGDVVLVEPYLAGTSAAEVAAALVDRPHRLLSLGVATSSCAATAAAASTAPPTAWTPMASAARSQDSSKGPRSRLCRLVSRPHPSRSNRNARFAEHRPCPWRLGGWIQLERRHRAPAGRRLQRHRAPVPADTRSPTTSRGCARCCACRAARRSSPATPTAVRSSPRSAPTRPTSSASSTSRRSASTRASRSARCSRRDPRRPALAHLSIDEQGFAWLPEDDFVGHFAADVDPVKAKVMYAVQQPLAAARSAT